MDVNRKIYALFLVCLSSLAAAVLLIALPRLKKISLDGLMAFQGPAADLALKNLESEYRAVSVLTAVLAVALLAAAIYCAGIFLKPLNTFIGDVTGSLPSGPIKGLEGAADCIKVLCNNAGITDCVPIGIMVVDREGVIRFFNREAGEITEQNPLSVAGRPMQEFFPNNYHSYTMEVIKTGREYLGLRNIIKAGNFFREVLLSISPLRSEDTVSGAVAVFQDVTPQRKMIEVQAAYNLARDLVSQKDLGSTARVIARSAAEMVEIEFSAVFLADQDGRLIIKSFHGIPAEVVEKYNSSPYRLDSPEITDPYRNRVPLLHGDVRNKPGIRAHLLLPDISSFYSFPILYEDHIIGFLNLYSKEKNKLSRDMIYLLQSLSGQVHNAITNFFELQKMRTQASVDGLTGLYNKKYFLEALGAGIHESAAAGTPLSLAMIDIDHFKSVNDTYGHQTGDLILKEVAGLIAESVRDTDSVCRYGGEEFSIIMPSTPRERAIEVVERVRARAENSCFSATDGQVLRITVSGGVACYPGDAETLDQIIHVSDTALYTAKRTGRNRVVGHERCQKMQN